MNEQGLFVGIAATPGSGKFLSQQKPWDCDQVLDELLKKCANVGEAITWLTVTTNISINGTDSRRIPRFREQRDWGALSHRG